MIMLSLLVGIASSGAVSAASFTVDTTIDAVDASPGDGVCATADGDCTLRAAIMEANALPGADTIKLSAAIYTLTIPGAGEDIAAMGDLDITDDLTISGAWRETTVIDGGGLDRAFQVADGKVVQMSDIAITNGSVPVFGPTPTISDTYGGGILNGDGAFLTLRHVSFKGNAAAYGGAIFNGTSFTTARLDLSDGFFDENVAAFGGAILNDGTTQVEDSRFLRNSGTGGAIFNARGASLRVIASSLNQNQSGQGGGILNDGDMLAENTTIGENTAQFGGGISNTGSLSLTDVKILGNTGGFGGGLTSDIGAVLLTRVTVAQNVAEGNPFNSNDGGGIFLFAGTFTAIDTVISGNRARANGGGLANGTGLAPGQSRVILMNSTVSGNAAGEAGGAIINGGGAADSRTDFRNVTVADNSANTGGGISNSSNQIITITNTMVAHNDAGGDCAGSINSAGHNLDSDGSCNLSGSGDLSGVDPLLGPLADNAGPTQTQALLPGSLAVDAGDASACPDTDQRGVARPIDGNGDGVAVCDIGAFEAAAGTTLPTASPTPPATAPPSPGVTPEAGSLPAALPRTGGRRW